MPPQGNVDKTVAAMETIIARQSVARRRRPYAPISGAGSSIPVGGSSGLGVWPQRPAKRKSGASGLKPKHQARVGLFEAQVQARRGWSFPRAPGLKAFLAKVPAKLRLFWAQASAKASSKAGAAAKKSPFKPGPANEGYMPLLLPGPLVEAPVEPSPSSPRSAPAKLGPALKYTGAGLLLAILGLGILSLARPSFPLPKGGLLPSPTKGGITVTDPLLDYLSPELILQATDSDLQGLPIPRSLELSSYRVKPGDSLAGIGRRFGLSVDSLVSLNGIKSIKALRAGTELKVPNMDGIIHIVTKGQSLGSIARSYHTELTALADANDLGSGSIRPGQTLFIPGARLPKETLRKIYGTSVIWPGRGPISSWFGYRADPFTGVRRYHAGIDIVVPMGSPIKAAMDGVVADAGYNGNYGNYVILSHGEGMQTLYGHLSSYSVRPGQRLVQGSVLGLSGNTGYSTGPHLHFGVYRGGVAVDPLKVLK